MLITAAGDARLNQDLALALLQRLDLPPQALEALNKNSGLGKNRKVRLAVVCHPRAPRHVSVPAIRHLYSFELMNVALMPQVAADVKRAAEEVLIGRLSTIGSGERVTLARRGSGRVAGALLLDKEQRVMEAALGNPQMTEALIVKALKASAGTALLAARVSQHQKWLHRNEVKMALLANEFTPRARVVQIAGELPRNAIREVLLNARLRPHVKEYLKAALERKPARG